MFSTAWTFPGTASTRQNKTNGPFSNPDNCKADDFNYATFVGTKFDGIEPGDGPELIATNFGFSIPLGATIVGIEVEIQAYTDANQIGEVVYLIPYDTGSPKVISGVQKTDDFTDLQTTGSGGSPVSTHIYGSSTDTWSAGLKPADVNTSEFGFVFMAYDDAVPLQVGVDYIKMRIHYNVPSPIIIMIGT